MAASTLKSDIVLDSYQKSIIVVDKDDVDDTNKFIDDNGHRTTKEPMTVSLIAKALTILLATIVVVAVRNSGSNGYGITKSGTSKDDKIIINELLASSSVSGPSSYSVTAVRCSHMDDEYVHLADLLSICVYSNSTINIGVSVSDIDNMMFANDHDEFDAVTTGRVADSFCRKDCNNDATTETMTNDDGIINYCNVTCILVIGNFFDCEDDLHIDVTGEAILKFQAGRRLAGVVDNRNNRSRPQSRALQQPEDYETKGGFETKVKLACIEGI